MPLTKYNLLFNTLLGLGLLVSARALAQPTRPEATPIAINQNVSFTTCWDDLDSWTSQYPTGARAISQASQLYPVPMANFVNWAIGSSYSQVQHYSHLHPDQWEFNKLLLRHRKASEAFAGWCRAYPEAARQLAAAGKDGFVWAGPNNYQLMQSAVDQVILGQQ